MKTVFRRIFIAILLVGYIVSGVYAFMNLFSINQNSKVLFNDFTAERVQEIGEDESIKLDNGDVIDGSEIKSYVKVNSGKGTWYIEDKGILVVETTYKDLNKLLSINIVYFLLIVVTLVRWLVKSSRNRVVKVSISAVCLFYCSIEYYFIFSYLSKVLNIGW